MKTKCFAFLAALCLCSVAGAQMTLTTTFANNNACQGNMFDVVAGNAGVAIVDFDCNLDAGPTTVDVYAVIGGGSWNQPGVMSTPGAWTLVETVNVTGAGPGLATNLGLTNTISIPPCATHGIYIVVTSPSSGGPMNYTNGSAVGSVLATDGNITVLEGAGDCTAGGFSPFTTRNWNGTIYYNLGSQGSCEWQVNQPGASLTMNGIPDPGPNAPIVVSGIAGSPDTFELTSTNAGMGWDAGLTSPEPGLPLSGGGLGTPGGQTLNIDFGAPSFVTLFNLAFANSFANQNIPITAGGPLSLSAQMGVINPAAVDGLDLSHLVEYTAIDCSAAPFPEDFESAVPPASVPFSNPTVANAGTYPTCWVDGGGTNAWVVGTGSTPSSSTGPSGANSGVIYMYCETSGGGNTYYLDWPAAQTWGTGASFAYFMDDFGSGDVGTLELQEEQPAGSGNWVAILSLVGAQGPGWMTTGTIVPTQNPTNLRFCYFGYSTFQGDVAIDDADLQ